MKLGALLIWPIFGLATVSSAPAARAEVNEPEAKPTLTLATAERFRFHAGARLLAPAGVAPDGSVCVGSVDGYVHGLAPDGSYRWSHTVRGGVTRRPVWNGERWLVVADADLYALQPGTGALSWVFKSLGPVRTELAVGAGGTVYYASGDGFFYGLSVRGGVNVRVPFGEPKRGPELAADGTIWAENAQGVRLAIRGLAVRRYTATEPSPHEFADPAVLRDPDGRAWRAFDDGHLEIDRDQVPLGTAPLLPPAWSTKAHAAIVSDRNGLVRALEPVPLSVPLRAGRGR